MPKKSAKRAKSSAKKVSKVSLKPIALAIDKAVRELKAASKGADEPTRAAVDAKIQELESEKARLPCKRLAAYPLQP